MTLTRAPDGHAVLHLRGTTTLLGDEEPLFVVDGIPLGPNAANLAAIDPHDIETVQVLRDAASTAAYGIRGANGVITIRTKQSWPLSPAAGSKKQWPIVAARDEVYGALSRPPLLAAVCLCAPVHP